MFDIYIYIYIYIYYDGTGARSYLGARPFYHCAVVPFLSADLTAPLLLSGWSSFCCCCCCCCCCCVCLLDRTRSIDYYGWYVCVLFCPSGGSPRYIRIVVVVHVYSVLVTLLRLCCCCCCSCVVAAFHPPPPSSSSLPSGFRCEEYCVVVVVGTCSLWRYEGAGAA